MHELVAQLLREPVESIDIDEDLLNRGLDSVRIMSLVEKWRREGKEITFADLENVQLLQVGTVYYLHKQHRCCNK